MLVCGAGSIYIENSALYNMHKTRGQSASNLSIWGVPVLNSPTKGYVYMFEYISRERERESAQRKKPPAIIYIYIY